MSGMSWGKKRFAVLERDGFKCVYCGRGPQENVVLHVDHVRPRKLGGADDFSNLVSACKDCNLAKGADPLNNGLAIVLLVAEEPVQLKPKMKPICQPRSQPQQRQLLDVSGKGKAARQKRWRFNHPDKHRDYMRDYMRDKRATQKLETNGREAP